jgi:probable phosphoglycerate mutase
MSTTEPSGRLVIVRHGQTSANLDGVWHGSTDTALTDHGHAQAQRVAEYLAAACPDAGALYASPLQRARHTAEPIASSLGLELRIAEDLREFDLGTWEGKTYRELMQEHRLWDKMKSDPHFAPHGGESPLGVAQRLAQAWQRIARTHPERPTVVVTHGGAISLALAHLLDDDYANWNRVMENCAVSELAFAPELRLVRFNHTAHLEAEPAYHP